VLSPAEKPAFEHLYAGIINAQSGIDTQASAFGITTEKSDYDNAISTLTAYLNTLTTPVAWDNKSGTTSITASTFLGYFNAVYTKRQTLLNAIYAKAKGLADAAQKTADGQPPLVINPFFTTGDLTGWTSDHGTVVFESGSNGPASASTTYARRNGSSGTPNEALRNLGKIPVYAGSVVKAQCLIRGLNAPNGTAGVRISWRDKSDTEITTSPGNTTTGNAINGTYVTGAAPADGFAHVECQFSNHTVGSYTVDNFAASSLADSMDQVPDGATRFGSIANAATQAQQAAQIAASYQPGQNILPNPSFALGATGWTFGAHWGVVSNIEAATEAAYTFQTSSSTDVCYTAWLPFGAGVPVCLGLDALCNGGIAGSILMDVQFASSTLTNLGYSNPLTIGPQSWSRVNGFVGNSLAGTAFARVRLYSQNASVSAIGPAARFTNLKLEIGSSPTPFSDDSTQYGNKLTVAASGQTVGDQRNLVSSITRNSGLVRSATALTATSAGAVNVNAHTITLGAAAIGYNAVPNAVTGLSVGSGYYIYTRDNYAGGTRAWAANGNATTVNGFDDAYNAGYVTIPSSGSSGGGGAGGGGGGSCVCADMYLRAGLTARDIAVRWRWWKPWLWFLRGREGWHLIRRRPRIVQEICMRLTVADGSTIDCSVSTPITTQSGESVQAPMAYGRMVWTDSGWQRVIECESLRGERDVVRICVGGHSFLAGANPFHRIDTHNVWKP
jgi:hypothetical protein